LSFPCHFEKYFYLQDPQQDCDSPRHPENGGRRLLRRIFGYNNELYELFSEPDIVKTIKIGRLREASHVIRMLDDNSIIKLTFLKPTVGKIKV
jgi:hypothetical protein